MRPQSNLSGMADRRFFIRFKSTQSEIQLVIAERAEVHGEHLVFINSAGEMAAMFLLEVVENWSDSEHNPESNGSS
jgi:hypothetical protein